MPTACMNFGLSADNMQIVLLGLFDKLIFDFLMVTKDQAGMRLGYLNYIESNIFSYTLRFVYANLSNLT